MYYDMAAMKYVNEILGKDPQNFEALTFKSPSLSFTTSFCGRISYRGKKPGRLINIMRLFMEYWLTAT